MRHAWKEGWKYSEWRLHLSHLCRTDGPSGNATPSYFTRICSPGVVDGEVVGNSPVREAVKGVLDGIVVGGAFFNADSNGRAVNIHRASASVMVVSSPLWNFDLKTHRSNFQHRILLYASNHQ